MKTHMLKPSYFIAIILLFIGVVNLTSCRKHRDYGSGDVTILGSWNWVKTYGGFAGGEETPASTGKEKTLIFYENGKYARLLFKAIEKSGNYLYGYDSVAHRQFIQFDQEPPQYIDILSSTILDFGSAPVDGISHRYSKIPVQ